VTNEATPSVERLLSESVWLASLARALLGRDEDAVEDVVQEARLAALQSAPADPDHARAWLARVTRNFALRVRLRRTRRERRERAAAVPEAQPSTLDLVARVNAQRQVAAAVVALEEPYRSVVLLRWFDALPVKDVAARLGVPVETVRTRMRRALAKLREQLDAGFGSRDAWAGLLLPWAVPGGGAGLTTAAGTGAKAAGVSAGAAAVVGAGVVAMSVTAKVATVAALVVAAAVAWRLACPGGAPPPTSSSLVAAGRAPTMADAPEQSSRSSRADAAATTEAARSPDAAAPSPPPAVVDRRESRVVATVVGASDEKPVEGAELRITYYEYREGARIGAERGVSARSDRDGHVEVVLPTPEPFSAQYAVLASEFSPIGPWRFDVAPSDALRHDLRVIKLERGTRVSGRVLRARDRTPVAGAELRLDRLGSGSLVFLGAARPIGTSRGDGSFTLEERVASANDRILPLYALGSEGIGIGALKIVPGLEEATDVEVLVSDPALLAVTVQDDTGAPMPDVMVCCTPQFLPMGQRMRGGEYPRGFVMTDPLLANFFNARSDGHGIATFLRLPTAPAGRLFGYGESGGASYGIDASTGGHDRASLDGIVVKAGATTRCAIVLPKTRSVTLVGKVTTRSGEPIPDARLSTWVNGSEVVATTDESGEYRFDDANSTTRSAYFQVRTDGFALHQATYEFAKLPRAALCDEAGAPLEAYTIDVVLERVAHIAGKVVDESGAPIAGAMLWFMKPPEMISFQCDPPATDGAGRFDFTATDAEWHVSAAAPIGDGEFGPGTSQFVKGGATDLVIVCPTRFDNGATLECEVVDAGNGAALPVRSAHLQTADQFDGGTTYPKCSLGSVKARELSIGRWCIDIETGDHRRQCQEFEVTAERQEVRLRIEVGGLASVNGHVELDPKFGDFASRRIHAWWRPLDAHAVDASGQPFGDPGNACTPVGTDGRFFLAGLVPGRSVWIYVTDRDALYDEVVFTPTAGEVRNVALRLRPSAQVVAQLDEDFTNGRLVVDLAIGDEPWHRQFFLDGLAKVARPPANPIRPGRHRWRALFAVDVKNGAPKVTSASGEFDVAAGETYVLRLAGLR
jgi:RNA polymerase sigma-70 factor (ECF subfamily)